MNLKDSKIPTGQDHNPSAWSERTPLLVLACIGFLIALYLGLFQVHVFSTVWDPFFGDGTKKILTSPFSKSLPIPDALLGAAGYLGDIILVSAGSNLRWREKPWIVIVYGGLVAIMTLVSIFLVILQAFIINTWCTLCLASALITFLMIWPVSKEFFATIHFLKNQKEKGEPVWKAAEGKQA